MKTVTIITNNVNCERLTQYFAKIEKYFKQNEFAIQKDFDSNLIVIIGCGYHDHMYNKIKNTIDMLHNNGVSNDKIVIMGCVSLTHYLKIKNENIKMINYGNEQLLDELIKAKVSFDKIKDTNLFDFNKDSFLNGDYFYIKIAQGCLKKCTFCVIKNAKGYIKSYSIESLLAQYNMALSLGYTKIYSRVVK